MTQLADLTGKTFGLLTVLEQKPGPVKTAQAHWLCRCQCGQLTVVNGSSLRRGRTRSCGCGRIKHGLTHAVPEYHVWQSMRQRCLNPNHPGYRYWGGRGITICQRWASSFEAFYADMGPRPGPEYSIDRIDNDGNYELGNCRWATPVQQQRNRRDRRHLFEVDLWEDDQ
jgi:hypothetical protein